MSRTYRITDQTWRRLERWASNGLLVGASMLPDVSVSDQVAERLEQHREQGDSDDQMFNRALDAADKR